MKASGIPAPLDSGFGVTEDGFVFRPVLFFEKLSIVTRRDSQDEIKRRKKGAAGW